MKKIALSLCALASLSFLDADMTRVEMGIGGWNESGSGDITYTPSSSVNVAGTYKSSENSQSEMYVWMLIKHPISILPNLRVEYVNVEDDGLATGKFENFTTPSGTPTSLQLTQYDIIPYYNILDNTAWGTLDLGLDAKIVEAEVVASQTLDPIGVVSASYTDKDTIVIPLLYGRGRIEIPNTNIGLEADLKYVTYSGSTIYDGRVKVDYTFDLSGVQPGIELGYRVQSYDIDDDNTKMDVDFSGVYFGAMLRF